MSDYLSESEEKYKQDFWKKKRRKKLSGFHWVYGKIFNRYLIPGGEVLLDAGGGVGNWGVYYSPYFKKIILLDISLTALKKIPEDIFKINADLLAIPLKDECIDKIICFDVMEHLFFEDLAKVAAEFYRVLKKDGILCIYTGCYGFYLRRLRGFLKGTTKGRLDEWDKKDGHKNRLTIGESLNLYRQAGFEIIEKKSWGHFFQYLMSMVFERLSSGGRAYNTPTPGVESCYERTKRPVKEILKKLIGLISYLDVLLFGWFIGGSGVFLVLKKSERCP